MSIYIVKIKDDEDFYEYEYSNLKHAREHLQSEENGIIYEYKDSKYYFVECK